MRHSNRMKRILREQVGVPSAVHGQAGALGRRLLSRWSES